MADNTYRTEIDAWLLTVFRVVSFGSIAAVVVLLVFGISFGIPSGSSVLLPVLALAVALPWWLLATTSYTFTDCELAIRSGPFHWKVALHKITAIKPVTSSVPSPALSNERLLIESSDGSSVMVSPERRKQFLDDMRARGVWA